MIMVVAEIICSVILGYIALAAYTKYQHNPDNSQINKLIIKDKKAIIIETVVLVYNLIILNVLNCNGYDILRAQALLSILAVISIVDKEKHLIPNVLLIVSVVERIVILVVATFAFGLSELKYMIGCFIVAAVIYLVFLLLRFITKNGVGMGDVKMFALIGLYLNYQMSLTSLLYSFFISFVLAIYYLVTKKKNRKDELPFAPCVLIGTMLAFTFMGV